MEQYCPICSGLQSSPQKVIDLTQGGKLVRCPGDFHREPRWISKLKERFPVAKKKLKS